MIKVILSGANGTMGRVLSRCIDQRDDCTVVAGIDPDTEMRAGYPVFAQASQCDVPADVIIDFSVSAALEPLLELATARHLPVVVATTGLSKEQRERISETAAHVPVFYSANMSLGINLMLELAKTAARVLGGQYDIEIIERHHNQKVDAPSGTALMLADGIGSVLEESPQYVYDRHSQRKKRSRGEIGLHAVRGGTIVGEHDTLFAGPDEVITISHAAYSKEVFATGAVRAALFLADQAPGLYNMENLI